MRICELVQTGTETVTNTVTVDDYDDNGNVIGSHEKTVTKEVPVMETVYRDATPEEEAAAAEEAAAFAEYERTRPRTVEERVEAMDNADTGELAEIRAALVELADIVMGG